MAKKDTHYSGFEQGPIRPPSEAASLLIRVTRNCPWNRCTFCPVYKGASFSLRPVEHVIADIDHVKQALHYLKNQNNSFSNNQPLPESLDRTALQAAVNWMRGGMKSIFLQDANSLIIKPDNLITILLYLKKSFPWVERITSYARSHTIGRIADQKLKEMHDAGLNRIHIGMESGSDRVLEMVKKGSTKSDHIRAGIKVKKAGMELSEYVMPGLGGKNLSKDHALETADALNQINADFIRLRSLAVPGHVELHDDISTGLFTKLTDFETAKEIKLFLEKLQGITSTLKSDHILNLFEEVEGKYPEDKEKMISVINDFLELPDEEKMIYQVGRRTGVFRKLQDLNDPIRRNHAVKSCERFDITVENVDDIIEELIKRFI